MTDGASLVYASAREVATAIGVHHFKVCRALAGARSNIQRCVEPGPVKFKVNHHDLIWQGERKRQGVYYRVQEPTATG